MRHPARRPPLRLTLAAAAVVLACGGARPRTASSSAVSAPGGPAPAAAPAPAPRIARIPDATTAAILLTSHNADLAAARIAAANARSRDVKLLALSMVTDHTTMGTTLTRLVSAINLTPREDDVSRLLRDQSAARRDTLRRLSGWPFDSTYVENEVRFHQDLLEAIDRVFLPSARNASLKEYVSTMRPTIAAHLQLAEQVRDAITAGR